MNVKMFGIRAALVAALLLSGGCATVSGQVISKTYTPEYYTFQCQAWGSDMQCIVYGNTRHPECWGLNTSGGSVCVSKEVYDKTPVGSYYTDEEP